MGWWCSWLCLLLLLTCQFTCSLSSTNSSSSRHLCNSDESSALLQFKNSFSVIRSTSDFLDGFSFPKTDYSWTKDEDCCAWRGVTCEGVTGHVTGP
ncbi:hypothetical protein M0R45_015478 [Rubus argutus]|uniref:Leucine-rich repeat-containing N-terminal plant-type domain-containing protein n=1 Tax=Rubus argutus TaxID=59490 RepID=A0AAW1XPM1_RUBAR